MRFVAAVLLPGLLFLGAGCSIFPSTWHPFGTPVTRAEKADTKQQAAEARVLGAVQEELHKTTKALDVAVSGNEFGLPVAQTHARAAKSLVDQALGPPTLLISQKWDDLIQRQTSQDEAVRKIADKEAAKRLEQIGKLSADLRSKEVALEEANRKAVEYANELQSFKDSILKVAWVVGGFFLLYFLGQILQFLANFNPAFGTAANAVNAFVSPALHAAAYKARKAAAAAASAVRSS